jgi:hypothetical protein
MQKRPARKLLVASLGVAAVSYVACGDKGTVANLVPPPQDGAVDAPKDSPTDAPMEGIVANLVPPPADGGLE